MMLFKYVCLAYKIAGANALKVQMKLNIFTCTLDGADYFARYKLVEGLGSM